MVFCQPADPRKLFDDFWTNWTDDFVRKQERLGRTCSQEQLRTMVRLDIQVRLKTFEKDLADFGLEPMTEEEKATVALLVNVEEEFFQEEMDFVVNELRPKVAADVPKLTKGQREIYNTVMRAVREKKSLQLFISARGGCGKTHLLNILLDSVRSLEDEGCIALATATTGIAAQLLNLGRTFHSRLKAPLHVTEDTTLNIPAQGNLAKLVCRCRLLLIDEANMLH